jgi:hypothetical protein
MTAMRMVPTKLAKSSSTDLSPFDNVFISIL